MGITNPFKDEDDKVCKVKTIEEPEYKNLIEEVKQEREQEQENKAINKNISEELEEEQKELKEEELKEEKEEVSIDMNNTEQKTKARYC